MGRVGQQFIRFDAPSKRTAEVGFMLLKHGGELAEDLYRTTDGSTPDRRLMAIGDWLMPIPHQLRTDWGKDPDGILSDYVLTESMWGFSPEIDPVEWVPSSRPGTAGPAANKWLSLVLPSSGITDVGTVDFSFISSAIGATLPTGMKVIATAFETPSGESLSDCLYTPAFYWNQFPAPEECVILGFGPFAVVLYDEVTYFLEQANDGTEGWKLIGVRKIGAQDGPAAYSPGYRPNLGKGGRLEPLRIQSRGVIVIPVGPDELHVFFPGLHEDPLICPVRNSVQLIDNDPTNAVVQRFPGAANSLLVGPDVGPEGWWLAAQSGSTMQCQVQVVGYDYALPPFSNIAPMFDLGDFYKPTVAQDVNAQTCFFGKLIDVATSSSVSLTTDSDLNQVWDYVNGNQVVTVGVRDENGDPWVSDGTHQKGYLSVNIQAGNPGGIGGDRKYLTPQVRIAEMRFATVLEDRPVNTVTLDDTHWESWKCSVSHRDPNGKRLTFPLYDSGVSALNDAGLTERGNYRVEVLEDTNGDGTPDTVRCAAWIKEVGGVVRRVNDDLTEKVDRLFDARGLLHRVDQHFKYLMQMTDPGGNGFVEHSFAVAQVLLQFGINTTSTSEYLTPADPNSGTNIARLPGTWATEAGASGIKNDSPWAPDWDETGLQYCERIASTWADWRLYEEVTGVVRYHPDLFSLLSGTGVKGGLKYYPTATLYRTQAAAIAAGVSGKQTYLADGEGELQEPAANVIRVTGTDSKSQTIPHACPTDRGSLNDITNENFVGEELIQGLTSKLAIDDKVALQIALVVLGRLVHRSIIRKVEVPLAYWQVKKGSTAAPLDAGRVVTLDGYGDFRIIHMEHETISTLHDVHRTRLVLQSMPKVAQAGSTAGGWPGIAS